jgi:hypothetical protein
MVKKGIVAQRISEGRYTRTYMINFDLNFSGSEERRKEKWIAWEEWERGSRHARRWGLGGGPCSVL